MISGVPAGESCECFPPSAFFPWYAEFLRSVVLPNSAVRAALVLSGEILIGLSLLLGLFTNLGAFAGAIMSINFFFGAGWTSPDNAMLNLLMVAVQSVVLLSPEAKKLGLDERLSRTAPKLRRFLVGERR